MKPIFLLLLILVSTADGWAEEGRNSPNPQEQKLAGELAADREYRQIDCAGNLITLNAQKSSSERRLAFETFVAGNRKIKLKRVCVTVEGDPIITYLSVEKGTAVIYVDSTRDDFGPKRLISYSCTELDIGTYAFDRNTRRRVFQKEGTEKVKEEALRCLARQKDIVF